ncbi:MAG: peptidoglycan recognition family protein [Phycisphaerales bacterium]
MSSDSPSPNELVSAAEMVSAADAAQTRRRCMRTMLVAAAAVAGLAGCSTSSSTRAARPEPLWPEDLAKVPGRRVPRPVETVVAPDAGAIPNLVSRDSWARGTPVPALMNRMTPVRSITVHHDGMPPVSLSSRAQIAGRIEQIRAGHRAKGWGDIGYHFIVDPQGAVWQGRPLLWQGAHVKDRNEGNVGVLVLGNFESTRPTTAQLESLERQISALVRLYRVSATSVRSHQEWPGAATACPGRHMQAKMNGVRDAVRQA